MNKENKKETRKEYFAEYNKKNQQTRITFSNVDYEFIKKVAEQQGLSVSSFIRFATIEQANNIYQFPKEIDDKLKIVVRNLRGIGTNINQIARYTNEQKYSSPDTIQVLMNYLKGLEEEIKNIKRIIEDWKNTSLKMIEREVKKIESFLVKNSMTTSNKVDNLFKNLYWLIEKRKDKKKSKRTLKTTCPRYDY